MGKPGIIAFPVLLALGAVAGYLTYTSFTAATPQEGLVDSPYRQELINTGDGGNQDKTVDETKFSKVVTIKILDGASVQGNPDYDPDASMASSDSLITWINEDSVPHTSTSGTGPSDPDSGKIFDSSILTQGAKFSIPAEELGAGEHKYYCTVHPYMISTITVE